MRMNKFLSVPLLALVTLTGCANHYRITLTNGSALTAVGKPKLDPQARVYRYKDVQGNPQSVPVFRVQEIAPNQRSSASNRPVAPGSPKR